jgi:hypothetical protein
MSEQKSNTESIVHGIILGGSIGLIGGWFGMDPGRAVLLGLICGLLAGLTKYRLDKRGRK